MTICSYKAYLNQIYLKYIITVFKDGIQKSQNPVWCMSVQVTITPEDILRKKQF